jgi:hypothetical protein
VPHFSLKTVSDLSQRSCNSWNWNKHGLVNQRNNSSNLLTLEFGAVMASSLLLRLELNSIYLSFNLHVQAGISIAGEAAHVHNEAMKSVQESSRKTTKNLCLVKAR